METKSTPFLPVRCLVLLGVVIVATAVVTWFLARPQSYEPASGLVQITNDEALQMQATFLETATPTEEVVRGMSLNINQYNAMEGIKRSVAGVAGFRIYYGLDEGAPVMLIKGVDAAQQDITTLVYKTNPGGSGLCPPVCDMPDAND
ncbi:MAG TPA: hypothetical protein P5531_11980 [Bacteroidales bacterium]|nr:hypothetical protein [Bacteroidales bacterium]HSA44322.1 hypothetical protein [Bacteroidales bacterium]